MSEKQKKYTKRYMKRLQLSYSILKKVIATVFYGKKELTNDEFFKSLTPEERFVYDYLLRAEENKRLANELNGELRGKNDKE